MENSGDEQEFPHEAVLCSENDLFECSPTQSHEEKCLARITLLEDENSFLREQVRALEVEKCKWAVEKNELMRAEKARNQELADLKLQVKATRSLVKGIKGALLQPWQTSCSAK